MACPLEHPSPFLSLPPEKLTGECWRWGPGLDVLSPHPAWQFLALGHLI